MSSDLIEIVGVNRIMKGASFTEPMVMPVPMSLLVGQTHYIINQINVLENDPGRYTCPDHCEERLYHFGASIEVRDLHQGTGL